MSLFVNVTQGIIMNPLYILLVVLLIFLLLGAPMVGLHHYGWAPSGGIGIVILIVLLVLIFR